MDDKTLVGSLSEVIGAFQGNVVSGVTLLAVVNQLAEDGIITEDEQKGLVRELFMSNPVAMVAALTLA